MAAPNTHEDFAREEHIEGSSDRGFGLVFSGFFAIVTAVSLWRSGTWWPWTGGLSAAFLAVAYTVPSILGPLNRLWMKFGLLIFKVMNPIILGLLFFTTVMPIGLVMRLFGKDFLRLRRDAKAASYWIDRTPPGPKPESMRNQF
ncbi:MAG: hypothetical protein FJX02_03025 [Alphaproteobacteria bacterium]|nr:hypothetical protein [Alphaproteobacteria bacterium]